MFATHLDSRSLTPALYADAVRALGPSVNVTERATVSVARATRLFPPVQIALHDVGVRFDIARIRTRNGAVYFFANGRAVLLPGPGRDRAREVVAMFVSILNAHAR